MKDLVLINSPIQEYSREKKPDYFTTAPIGLGYLATIASQAGYGVEIVDAEAEKLSPGEVVERVSSLRPSIVGINAFSTNHRLALDILNRSPADYRLVGGPHATLRGHDIHGNYGVVQGEAENVFLRVLAERPRGIITAGVVEDLDALPHIDRRFFVNDPYDLENSEKEASINSSRGCQFSCAYCSVPTINGKRMRSRSIEDVVGEIEELADSGVNGIHFTDDLFNFTKERIVEFTDALARSYANPSWRALCRVENLDEELLVQMRESGCYRIAVGVESATPRILKYIGKSQDTARTKRLFDACRDLDIETKAFFTIGYPTETADEIERTLDFAMELDPTEARFMVVRAFPGTRLYEDMLKTSTAAELDKYAQSTVDEPFVKYHVMNVTPLNGMSPEVLDEYIRRAYLRFSTLKGEQHESLHSV
jgi:anaerobic magnesium-protoporphyrin IX monomethyl ester cyclase